MKLFNILNQPPSYAPEVNLRGFQRKAQVNDDLLGPDIV